MKRPPPVRYEHTDNELHDVMVNIGLTRAEFARLLGVSRQTVNTWLTGTKPSAVYEVIIDRMKVIISHGRARDLLNLRKIAKTVGAGNYVTVSQMLKVLHDIT